MNQPELGKKVAELRKAKYLTQEQLVEKCNISVRTLQRIEAGEVQPRNYTVRLIFEALDFELVPFEEELRNQNNPQWHVQFYSYFIDLFNLKTNTMKKITILSLFLLITIWGISALNTELKAQKLLCELQEPEVKSQTTSEQVKEMVFAYFSCDGCFDQNEFRIGRDVKFQINGVTVDVRLLLLNMQSREFNVGFCTGKLLNGKIEVNLLRDRLGNNFVEYSAESVTENDNTIQLNGKAVLKTTQNETIEAESILIKLQ